MEMKIDDKVKEFIMSLEKATISKTFQAIDILGDYGPMLRLPHSKKISKNIFELRIKGMQEVRIFYAFYKNKIILLHGFIKKSQKLPVREIEYAEKQFQLLT
jgi:phage-related protein